MNKSTVTLRFTVFRLLGGTSVSNMRMYVLAFLDLLSFLITNYFNVQHTFGLEVLCDFILITIVQISSMNCTLTRVEHAMRRDFGGHLLACLHVSDYQHEPFSHIPQEHDQTAVIFTSFTEPAIPMMPLCMAKGECFVMGFSDPLDSIIMNLSHWDLNSEL